MVNGTTVPRLAFVGAMLGGEHGRAPTQAQTLVRLLAAEGAPVWSTSTQPNRYRRFADIASTLLSRRADMDVMMLQVFSGPSFVVEDTASAIGRATGVPVVMTLRGGDLPRFAERFPRWTRRVLGRAAAIVAPSRYLAHELAWLKLPLHVIPNTIDFDSYPFRARTQIAPRLLWMRAFHPIYDPLTAVAALAVLRKRHPLATLTMGGPDMGLLDVTRAETERLGVADAVRFVGFLDEAAKRAAGAEHDIYLNTNRIDNMPVSVLEMGAMGLPVVATRVGGIPFLLDTDKNALLVPAGDPAAVAAAVGRLLTDPELVQRLSAGGRELARGSSWERIRPQWLELLGNVTRPR
jgi:glycosyltransferase involved in cell wall biosynthesis